MGFRPLLAEAAGKGGEAAYGPPEPCQPLFWLEGLPWGLCECPGAAPLDSADTR